MTDKYCLARLKERLQRDVDAGHISEYEARMIWLEAEAEMEQKMSADKYYPGKGCKCEARSSYECGCNDVDWTPAEVHELREQLSIANDKLKRIAEVLEKNTWGHRSVETALKIAREEK